MTKTFAACSWLLLLLGIIVPVCLFPTPIVIVPYMFFALAIMTARRLVTTAAVMAITLSSVAVGFWFFFDARFIHLSTMNLVPLEVTVAESVVAILTWLVVAFADRNRKNALLNSVLKYSICISLSVITELAGVFFLFMANFTPCTTANSSTIFPSFLAFVFPYAAVVSPIDNIITRAIGLFTLVQLPLYGLILGRAWARHQFVFTAFVLSGVHILTALLALFIHW